MSDANNINSLCTYCRSSLSISHKLITTNDTVTFMLFIGIVARGKYGSRLLNTIIKNTNFKVSITSIPSSLPDLIDDPSSFVDDMLIDANVLSADLVITYSLHPDITPEIVRRAAEMGVKAVIIPGGLSRAGDPHLLDDISKKYNIRILIEDICCAIGRDEDPIVDEFASRLGTPELEIRVKEGSISGVKVIRGAPCGSTWWMAEGLTGVPIQEASARAGLLVQQYPCRAVRGTTDGIHRSAQLHKKALEDAINKYYEERR